MDEFHIIRENDGADGRRWELCVRLQSTGVRTGGRAHSGMWETKCQTSCVGMDQKENSSDAMQIKRFNVTAVADDAFCLEITRSILTSTKIERGWLFRVGVMCLINSVECEGDGDVVSVVTPLGGVAQTFHGDQVVDLRVQLGVHEEREVDEDGEGQVEVEGWTVKSKRNAYV